MNLKDYIGKEQELIGKTVLIETRFGRSLSKINRVTKKYFQVESDEKAYFDTESGRQKGTGDRWTHATYAKLVTDQQAMEMRVKWTRNRQAKEMREKITHQLPNLTYEQLVAIIKLITDEKGTNEHSADNSLPSVPADGI